MSAIFHLKYKGGFLHLHENLRKVTRVSERSATAFTSEAEAWHAAKKLRLEIDFVEITCPDSTVADVSQPAVSPFKLNSAAASAALILFFAGRAVSPLTAAEHPGAHGVTRPNNNLPTAGPTPAMLRPERMVIHKRGPGNCIKAPARSRSVGQTCGSAQISEAQAVDAILGEASNQGPKGMFALACALRNRGTLNGVYGVVNPVVKSASPALRAQAATAWVASGHGPDITKGATHWGTLRDVQTASFYSRLTFTVQIGDHYFYRTPARSGVRSLPI